MNKILKFVFILFPFITNAQTTQFSAQQDLFNLASNHYQLDFPMIPFLLPDTSLIFLGYTGGKLTEYKKDATGFYKKTEIKTSDTNQAILAFKDFNNDGKLDILDDRDFLKNEGDEFSKVYFNNWRLTPRTYGDYNGDGLLDYIAEVDNVFDPGDIYFMKNTGNFNFEEIPIEKGKSEYETFASGDIDGDGDLDFVATTNKEKFPIRIYFNEGNGKFIMNEKEFFEDDCWTMSVELVDFDGDKDLEIILEDAFRGIYIFKNIDNFKTFEAISDNSLSFVSQPLIVKAFDFNYDKLMDLVVFRQTQNTLYVDYYEASSQYKFKPARQIMTFKGGVLYGTYDGTAITRNMNFVDINGDGKMDITVTAGFDKKQFAVLNTTILSSNDDLLIDEFSINPNILVDKLSLDLPENSLVNIIDANGQIVLSQYLIGQSINISNLRSGTYFLQVLSKEGKLGSSRFVKVD